MDGFTQFLESGGEKQEPEPEEAEEEEEGEGEEDDVEDDVEEAEANDKTPDLPVAETKPPKEKEEL